MTSMATTSVSQNACTLNAFQVLMRRWRELAPYNAGQVMTLSGTPDFVRWASCAQKIVSASGIGAPHFAPRDAAVTFNTDAPLEVTSAQGDLESHVTSEMNRPFGPHDIPVRFFILPAGNHYHVGITYDHWVSDSRAIRNLMQRVYIAYSDLQELPPLSPPTKDFFALFGHHKQLHQPLAKLRASVINYIRHRRAYRINLNDPLNFESKTRIVQLPEGLIKNVHAFAKKRGASVNDAFLAALAQCMGDTTFQARKHYNKRRFFLGRRNRIALGTIADIRDLSSEPLENIFGLYLSSYTTVLKSPENQPKEQLLTDVSHSTHKLKENQGVIGSFLGLMTTLFWWDFYPQAKDKARLFQKNIPVVAGISNVNMSRSWVDMPTLPQRGPQIVDYLRISPTGPLLPIVLTLTTINQRLSLCVTYRTTAFTDAQAQAVIDTFTERLKTFAETNVVI